jgi:hypothetical protein
MSRSLSTEGVDTNPDQPGNIARYLAAVLYGQDLSVCHLDREHGPIIAKRLVRLLASEREGTDRLLVVTDGDIRVPPLRGLFGYADRRKGIAVVSTARLRDPHNPARTRRTSLCT